MNAQQLLPEDSMTSVPSYLVISLALMQREHQRLDASEKQLRLGSIPIEQLYSLRQQWNTSLGFLAHLPPLLAALDRLIEQHENGDVTEDAYGDVLYQIVVYRGASWKCLEQKYGLLGHYLEPKGKLRTTYLQLFTHTFEASTPFTCQESTELLQRLHPQWCGHPRVDICRKIYERSQKALSATLAHYMLCSIASSVGMNEPDNGGISQPSYRNCDDSILAVYRNQPIQ